MINRRQRLKVLLVKREDGKLSSSNDGGVAAGAIARKSSCS